MIHSIDPMECKTIECLNNLILEYVVNSYELTKEDLGLQIMIYINKTELNMKIKICQSKIVHL